MGINDNNESIKNDLNQIENEVNDDSFSKVNIDKYRDLDGLTMKKLNFGLWYLENKKGLLISIYIILGAISVITWFIFFKAFGYYILFGMNEDSKMMEDMINNPGVSHEQVLKTAAHPIQIDTIDVLVNSSGSYDIVAKITNVNRKYFSNFSYSFNIGNEIVGPFEGFILADEEKYLILLDQKLSKRPTVVNLDIENTWNKIDGHQISDWPAYRDNFIDFTVENKVFSNPNESNLSEKLNLSVVEFDIKNNSAYSYYQVDLDILLYSRGSLVSVSQYSLDRFISEETRHVDITWPGKVTRADSIVVLPNVNIMREKARFIP